MMRSFGKNAAFVGRLGLLALALFTVAGRADAATNPLVRVEPAALHLLQAAVSYLNGQTSYSFTADIAYDDVQPSGVKYSVRATAQYDVARPGQLFVSYTGDRRKANFYSDGKTFVFYDQTANTYGMAPASNDIDATLNGVFAKYDFTVPLDDFVSNQPGSSFTRRLLTGYDLGPSTIGDVSTHHLLFTQSDIDWQIWIDDGPTPLVRAFSITYKKLPAQPEYTATFRDWKFGPIDPGVFAFTAPKGAIHVQFVPTLK